MKYLLFAALATVALPAVASAQSTINALPAAPSTAPTDGVACQPLGAGPGTSRRCTPTQIVSAGGLPSVTVAGMRSGGMDNSPYLPNLMNLLSSAPSAGYSVHFTPDPTKGVTDYYFSQALTLTRSGIVACDSAGGERSSVRLVFAPGVDGVVFDNNTTSSDGGLGGGQLSGCGIWTLGTGTAWMTKGSGTLTNVSWFGIDGLTGAPPAPGDGLIVVPESFQSYPGHVITTPPGAVVGSTSGTNLTLGGGAVVDSETTQNSGEKATIFLLPAALADVVNTTAGSNTVTVTGGTTKFASGDMIWSPAFPFLSRVFSASGAVGAQTLTITDNFMVNPQQATISTGGSRMWRVPAGIRRRTASSTYNNYVRWFPVGLDMGCMSSSYQICTGSQDVQNTFQQGIIGRSTAGDNTGASTSAQNIYANYDFADIIEGGTIGSLYSGDNSNSGEFGSAQPVVGNCANQNYSLFQGMYIGGGGNDYCLTGGVGPIAMQQVYGGSPDMVSFANNELRAPGYYDIAGSNPVSITSGTYDPATGNVSVTTSKPHGLNPGDQVGIQAFGPGFAYLITSGNVTATAGTSGTTINYVAPRGAGGMNVAITSGTARPAYGGQCARFNSPQGFIIDFKQRCVGNADDIGFTYNPNGALYLIGNGAAMMGFAGGGYTSGYQGDQGGHVMFPRGFVLGAGAGERLFNWTNGSNIGSSTSKQGDVTFYQAPAAGGFAAFVDTADGANFRPAMPVANDPAGIAWSFGEVISTGPQPTFGGSCAVQSATGGASAGSFGAAAACTNGTVMLTFAYPAPNGWTCSAHDMTAPANAIRQTATTPAGCTFTGTMAAGDRITFSAVGW